jgi:hypothetical protein
MTLAAEIWTTLSKINVNENIEKKGNLSYLSWTWAWSKLMEHFPDSYYHFEDRKLENGTVEVTCILSIHKGDQSVSRHMWLPVMDHKNNSIINPSSRMVSDAKMRCLVKAIGIMGLGLYIYAGEDLPAAEKERIRIEMENAMVDEKQSETLNDLIKDTGTDADKFCEHYKIASIEMLPLSQFEQAVTMLKTKLERMEKNDAS